MNIERLQILSPFLRTVPPEHLRMQAYVTRPGEGPKTVPGCGTAACAGAWATKIPAFEKAGLSLSSNGFPRFEKLVGMLALDAFFELDRSQSDHLFGSYNAFPGDVADRIDALLREDKIRREREAKEAQP